MERKKVRPSTSRLVVTLVFVGSIILFCTTLIGLGYFIALKHAVVSPADTQRRVVASEGEVIADIAQTVGKSVVSIVTERSVSTSYERSTTGQAAGTGLIIDASGLILTNKHVVPDGTSSVKVIMSDGISYDNVAVIGRDPLNDIAILQVKDPKNFVAAKFGDSDAVRTGQKVVAIGNALGQFQNTVTSGIISGVGRPVQAGNEVGGATESLTNLFQTDAAINSGNSGGPLLNYSGEVIGINTAIAADAQNIGFSIPINEAKGVIASIQKTGKLSRPFLGIRFVSLTPSIAKQLGIKTTTGAWVNTEQGSIVAGSPAEASGLRGGDIITKVDSADITAKNTLDKLTARHMVGDTITITILRDGKLLKKAITLSEAPNLNQ